MSRFLRQFIIAGIAAAFLLPAIPASACEAGAAQSTSVVTTGLAAAAKKDADKKPMKKAAKKTKKEKVQYMRAVPM